MLPARRSLILALIISASPATARAGNAENWEQFAKLSPRDQDVFAIRSGNDRFPSEPPHYAWRIGMATSNCLRSTGQADAFRAALDRCLDEAASVHAKQNQPSTFAAGGGDDSRAGLGRLGPAKPQTQSRSSSGAWRSDVFSPNN